MDFAPDFMNFGGVNGKIAQNPDTTFSIHSSSAHPQFTHMLPMIKSSLHIGHTFLV